MPRALFIPVPLRGGVADRPNVAVRNVAARRLVDALLAEECSIPFKVLPDPYLYADYYAHTARPVALADIRDWAISRPRYGLPDACRDLRRMVANAKRYNTPESGIYAAALALERSMRRVVKELEKAGDVEDDEDALWHRVSVERSWYENVEVDQARTHVQQLAQRRATQAALRAARAPTAGTAASLEAAFADFIDDEDLFLRGAEHFHAFHNRRLGRIAPQLVAAPWSRTPAALEAVSVAAAEAAARAAAAAVTGGTELHAATARRKASVVSAGNGILPRSSRAAASAAATVAMAATAPSATSEAPPSAVAASARGSSSGGVGGVVHLARMATEFGRGPGSVACPVYLTAADEIRLRRLPAAAVATAAVAATTGGVLGKKRLRDGDLDAVSAASTAAGSTDDAPLPADMARIAVRFMSSGRPVGAALSAVVFDLYAAPPGGAHRRVCRLCAPSLLHEPVVGRKGSEGLLLSSPGAAAAAVAPAPRASSQLVLETPRFRELPTAYLQGRAPLLSHKSTSGFGAAAAAAAAAPLLSSLASGKALRGSGGAAAGDFDETWGPSGPPRDRVGGAATDSGSARSLGSSSVASTVGLDACGYDAETSRAFWEAYSTRKSSINCHADCIVSLVRATSGGGGSGGGGSVARYRRYLTLASTAAARALVRYPPPVLPGAVPAPAPTGDASSSATGGGSSDYHHPPPRSCTASGAAAAAAASRSSASAPYRAAAEVALRDEHRFERWLIRRRLHYGETHASDTAEYPPFLAECLNASIASYANLLAHMLHEAAPTVYRDVDPDAAGYAHTVWDRSSGSGGGGGRGGSHEDDDDDDAAAGEGDPDGHFAGLDHEALFAGVGGAAHGSLALPASDAAAVHAAAAACILRGKSVTPHALAYSLLRGEPRALIDGSAAAAAARGARVPVLASPPPTVASAGVLSHAVFDPVRLGALIDARDEGGSWWLAQVVDVRPEWAGSSFRGTSLDPAPASGTAASSEPVAVRVHYHGWPAEYDEWLDVPAQPVLAALVAASNGAPATVSAATRAAMADARIAPALTHAAPLAAQSCAACHNTKSGALLFCDAVGCGRAYHLQCLRPALDRPPTGKWFCPTAHRKGGAAEKKGARSDGGGNDE